MILWANHPQFQRWAENKLGIKCPESASIAVLDRQGILAVALFNHHVHPDIHITFVSSSPRWAVRGVFRGILSYPFIQLHCSRITAITEAKNQPARAFLQRFGFREEGHHPELFSSGDGVSYGLLRRDCRWLGEENVEISTSSARSA